MPTSTASSWTDIDWSASVRDANVAGRRVRYLDHGEGPVLVLLHGMGGCWQWWLEVLPELTRHHRVIAVDLPGFGHSEPLPPPAEMDTHADVVVGLLDELGLASAIVAGHSMGGLVAISLATRHAERVDRLVLVDAGGVPMSERRLKVILQILRVSFWAFTRPAMLERLATNAKTREHWLKMAFRDPRCLSPALAREIMPLVAAPGFLGAIAASARAVRSTRPELITVPTLLVWGARDAFAPLHAAHAMLDRLPDGRLEVLGDIGHSPMVEDPRGFLDAVIGFTSAAQPTPTPGARA